VAEGDGASAYMGAGVVDIIPALGTDNFVLEFIIDDIGSYICGEYLTSGNKRGWTCRDFSEGLTQFLLGKADGTYFGIAQITHITDIEAGDKVRYETHADGANLVFTVYKNGVANGTGTLTGQNKIYCNGADLTLFEYNNSNFSSASFHNLKIWTDDVLRVDYSLEGHGYDTSGNNKHLTNYGVDLTSTTTDISGLYSYLFNEGFDRYTDDATGLVTIDVPYVSGVPVVSSITGYTKQSEHPQASGITKKWNNIAPVFFAFAGLDRSDTDDFTAVCRASEYYDSGNPTFWHASELAPNTLQSFLEPTGDLHNTLFSGSTPNEYLYLDGVPQYDDANGEAFTSDEDETKVQDFCVYGNSKTKAQVIKIMKYYKKEVGL